MPPMELSEAAEDLLSEIWVARERQQPRLAAEQAAQAALEELTEGGLVEVQDGALAFTAAGDQEAAAVVRRERLAERLLADVLNVGDALMAETACRFEHLLRRGIDDQICTLLGHPRLCPHGNPIPSGPCCQAGAGAAGRVVSPLADLAPGQGGVIAYVQSQRPEVLQHLLAMGALPGAPVVLVQRFPSFVFALGYGQVAVDRETAKDIYVRLEGRRRPPGFGPGPFGFGRRFRGLLWRRHWPR